MEELVKAVSEMMEDEAIDLTKKLLDQGEAPVKVLDAYKDALVVIGKRFEEGVYFVPELIMAGEMMKTASELMKPYMTKGSGSASESNKKGKFLLGTVEGDIHDIGKDMVGMLLDINGFEVKDLGVDVPAQKFLDEYKAFQPDIVGMSGLLTLAYDSMKKVVDGLKDMGVRDKVKVIIGGGQVDEHACKFVGADAWATDAVSGVKCSLQWIGN
ncbi:MAG: B12-binding domain-containing protein [Syntrophobacteraceae bacterium]